MNSYGVELILDLHQCDISNFTRKGIEAYLDKLCKLIDMDPEDLHFWDYEGDPEGFAAAPPHLKGVSAVQFIKTSTIVIHTLDDLRSAYINIFSCKDFNPEDAERFTSEWFGGTVKKSTFVERTKNV